MAFDYHKLPQEVTNLLVISDGWLVGSSIDQTIKGERIKDYDIIVTDLSKYGSAVNYMRVYPHEFNTFGGLKFRLPNFYIDLWPQDFERFISMIAKDSKLFKLNGRMMLVKS